MIEVKLAKLIIDEKRPEQLVVLREKQGQRMLPIAISINEASAIRMKLNQINPSRPLTHDLICQIIESLEVKVSKIVIDNLEAGVFYAKIYLAGFKQGRVIDARPSDSIALAVRTNAPIFVEEKIFSLLA